MSRRRRVLTGVFALVVLVAGGLTAVRVLDSDGTRITAYFDRTVGVYAGSDLRILGVRVGEVESVRPQGTTVRVGLLLDEGVKVPEGARAVVVAPSVVADRYVQLTPAYSSGPALAEGAVLPAARNRVPVEIDQLYESITELGEALGPDGANADGALSELLSTGAANLDGNGEAIGEGIEEFGKAAKTLDGSSGDLFGTLRRLQTFHPSSMTHAAMDADAQRAAGIGETLLRLSVGIEAIEDLVQDLRAGLDRAAAVK